MVGLPQQWWQWRHGNLHDDLVKRRGHEGGTSWDLVLAWVIRLAIGAPRHTLNYYVLARHYINVLYIVLNRYGEMKRRAS